MLAISLFFAYSLTGAQTTDTLDLNEVEALTKKMFEDINNRDYDAILSASHPKIFEIVPKETMKTLFTSTLEGNEEFAIDIPNLNPDYKISEIFSSTQDSLKYTFVSYDMDMSMTFKKQEFGEEEKKIMINMMKAQGMDVVFTSNSSLDVSLRDKITIVLKGPSTDNRWVMMNYETNNPLIFQILPSSILENAKSYQSDLILERKKSEEN